MMRSVISINRSGKAGTGPSPTPAGPSVLIAAHPEWRKDAHYAVLVTASGQIVDTNLLDDPNESLGSEVLKLFLCDVKATADDKLELSLYMPCTVRGISKPFSIDGKTCVSAEWTYMEIYPYESLVPSYQERNFDYFDPSIGLTKKIVIAPNKLWSNNPALQLSFVPVINTADKTQSAAGVMNITAGGEQIGELVLYRSPYGKLGPNDISSALISVQMPFESTAWPLDTRSRLCNPAYGNPAAISSDGSVLYWLGMVSQALENIVLLKNAFLTISDANSLPAYLDDVAVLSYGPSTM